jgi:cytidylate kinase
MSGGKVVADCLASRLGYPILGRAVLQTAAEELGVSRKELRRNFAATPGIWARLTQSREKYRLAVQTVLAEKCIGGNLVYHGLAGQFLLRGLPGVLRVLVIAPLEVRVRELQKNHRQMRRAQLEEFIEKVDEERTRWAKVMYQADVSDPTLYDLTVNLAQISRERACETIAMAASQPSYEVTEEVENAIAAFADDCRARLSRALGG